MLWIKIKHCWKRLVVGIIEVYYKNNILQQQQQDANEEIERLNREIQVGNNRIRELWRSKCE